MSKIILLVIIFNLVTALIANHLKKKKLEAARNENGNQKDAINQKTEVTRTLPNSPTLRKETGLKKSVSMEPYTSVGNSPASSSTASKIYRSKHAALEDDDHGRTVADSEQGRDVTSAPGIAAVEIAHAKAYVTPDGTLPTTLSALRADLLETGSLSRAFILKTVLDKPLSLQAYR